MENTGEHQSIKSITAAEFSEMGFQTADASKFCELYLIGAWVDDDLVAVKIGISKDCEQRLKELQSHTFADLSILGYHTYASVELARDVEKQAHKALEPYKMRGEWFRPDPTVLNYHPLFAFF